jgi:UDP-N-acetylmuramoyl-tripeptide--D-alanyl-D-alanine ligase
MGLRLGRLAPWIRQVALAPLVRFCEPLLFAAASLWRKLLFRTTFIAVTGSIGKTTTKELLARMLSSRGRTFRTLGNQNGGRLVLLNILRVRPWHRFAVLEIGIAEPGSMRRIACVVRPDVAVILAVARTHSQAFYDLDQYAGEKAILLKFLRPGGLAVLNHDDPRVANMASGVRDRVCLTGSSPGCGLWVDEVSSRWPDRLSFRAHAGEETCLIRTQHLGSHWVTAYAASLAVAMHLGVPLQRAAQAACTVPPYTARLEPVTLPGGAVLVRDDYSASIDTFEASLRFMREARADRRILVLSDYSDSGEHQRLRLKSLLTGVSGWLDLLVLAGVSHSRAEKKLIDRLAAPGSIRTFLDFDDATRFLKTELRQGDLVLLKGRSTDHVSRLFFALMGTVQCRQSHCHKTMLCDGCWELGFRPDPGIRIPSVGARV